MAVRTPSTSLVLQRDSGQDLAIEILPRELKNPWEDDCFVRLRVYWHKSNCLCNRPGRTVWPFVEWVEGTAEPEDVSELVQESAEIEELSEVTFGHPRKIKVVDSHDWSVVGWTQSAGTGCCKIGFRTVVLGFDINVEVDRLVHECRNCDSVAGRTYH